MLRSLSPLLRLAIWLGRKSRRLAVIVLGFAVLGSGLAMLVLPGPGLIVVLLGLALLATEFAWAEVALSRTAHRAATTASKVAAKRSGVIMLATSAISMIVGGATALLVLGRYRMPAASLMLAGLFALLVLIPRVRTWVEDRTARGNGAAAAFASAEKEHS